MATYPTLPARPLYVKEAVALSKTHDDIDIVRPLWGWVTTTDLHANALIVFAGPLVHLLGYDPDEARWVEVVRINEIVVGEAGPLFAGFETLESWVLEHYPKDELIRFDLNMV